jgi:hypothetical protein
VQRIRALGSIHKPLAVELGRDFLSRLGRVRLSGIGNSGKQVNRSIKSVPPILLITVLCNHLTKRKRRRPHSVAALLRSQLRRAGGSVQPRPSSLYHTPLVNYWPLFLSWRSDQLTAGNRSIVCSENEPGLGDWQQQKQRTLSPTSSLHGHELPLLAEVEEGDLS